MFRIWLHELMRSVTAHTAYWVLMICVISAGIIMTFFINRDVHYVQTQKRAYADTLFRENLFVLNPVDESTDADMAKYHHSEEMLNAVIRFSRSLTESDDWVAFEHRTSPFRPDEDVTSLTPGFYYGYSPDSDTQIWDKEEPELAASVVSDNTYDLFQLDIASGRRPSAESYTYHADRAVEVVLGSAYAGHFQLGDEITGVWQSEPMTLVVVGFLSEGSILPDRAGNAVVLDRSIVMPSFTRVTGTANRSGDLSLFRRIVFVNKPYSMLISDLPAASLSRAVYELSLRENSFPVRVQRIARADLSTLESTMHENFFWIIGLDALLLGVMLFAMITLIQTKFRADLRISTIYLVNGGSTTRLFIGLMVEMSLKTLFALIFAIFFLRLFILNRMTLRYYLPKMLWMTLAVFGVSAIPVAFQMRAIRLSEAIRRKHT